MVFQIYSSYDSRSLIIILKYTVCIENISKISNIENSSPLSSARLFKYTINNVHFLILYQSKSPS